jgi:hypothetical protein
MMNLRCGACVDRSSSLEWYDLLPESLGDVRTEFRCAIREIETMNVC